MGISERAYLTYEYGEREPKLDTLQKLADFYGVTTDYLLGRPDAKPPENPINAFAKNANLKELEKLLITEYLKLSDKQRESVINFMEKVIGNEEVRKNSPTDQTIQNKKLTLEEEADEFAELARKQFILEKKREAQASSVKESDAG